MEMRQDYTLLCFEEFEVDFVSEEINIRRYLEGSADSQIVFQGNDDTPNCLRFLSELF